MEMMVLLLLLLLNKSRTRNSFVPSSEMKNGSMLLASGILQPGFRMHD